MSSRSIIEVVRSAMQTLETTTVEKKGEQVLTFTVKRADIINIAYDAIKAELGEDAARNLGVNTLTSYIQMLRGEILRGQSAYRHHKSTRKIVNPDGLRWAVELSPSEIEYFKSRTAARTHKTKHGGKVVDLHAA